MRTLFLSFAFFLTISFGSTTTTSSNQEFEIVCIDYWYEYVYINGVLYFNEYCGDKLIYSTPVAD